MANVSEELARLAQLRDQGVLTEAEFEQQKAVVLASGDATGRPVNQIPAKKRGLLRNGCLTIVAIMIFLLVIGVVFGGKHTSTASQSATSSETPPMAVTATELFRAYEANEAAAQQTYGDRPLLVSGIVDKVDLDLMDNPVVLLRTPNQFMSAHAALADESKKLAAGITRGSSVSLLCSGVSEIISTPMLKDCVLK